MYFHLTNKLKQTYNALLGVESVACDSWSPPPVHGWGGGWGPHPWIYPQVAFSIPPSVYFIPFNSPCPLF